MWDFSLSINPHGSANTPPQSIPQDTKLMSNYFPFLVCIYRLSELLVCVRDVELVDPQPLPPTLIDQLGTEFDHYNLAKSYFDLKEYDR